MTEENKYATLSKEALVKEEKKLKRNHKIALIACILSVGNVLVTTYLKKPNGVFIVFLILGAIFLMMKFGTELKKVQATLQNK